MILTVILVTHKFIEFTLRRILRRLTFKEICLKRSSTIYSHGVTYNKDIPSNKIDVGPLLTPVRYQTSHFDSGFILEPVGQLNSVENSTMFDRGPITLYFGGQ